MEIWNDKDKIHITSNASSTLENFSQWRGNVLLRRKPHDVAQLITYVWILPFAHSMVFSTDIFQNVGKASGISEYRVRGSGLHIAC